jgi:hypothetical protein
MNEHSSALRLAVNAQCKKHEKTRASRGLLKHNGKIPKPRKEICK